MVTTFFQLNLCAIRCKWGANGFQGAHNTEIMGYLHVHHIIDTIFA
jgi:hypothetical protein